VSRKDQRITMVRVMDDRVDFLSGLYKPKKTTYANVEYLLPSEVMSGSENVNWGQARVCDALIHVVRNFRDTGGLEPESEEDFRRLDDEMILNDLMVAEKRVERIELDLKRGKRPNDDEYSLVKTCIELLESGRPLRINPELAMSPLLKGFTFLSAKPQLVIINNDDEDETLPDWKYQEEKIEILAVRGGLELEISSLPEEEAREFMVEYHIEKSALDRVINHSYSIMNLLSFFTVGSDEVRAWTIHSGTRAPEAAGVVHSDMQKGFIRAEVVSFDDFREYGNFKEAKGAGRVRLEGKEYIVRDGDIINFMFNV
jgi:GTP-binding protein YchF